MEEFMVEKEGMRGRGEKERVVSDLFFAFDWIREKW